MMNITRYLLMAFICLLSYAAKAQTMTVQGYIYDSQTRHPLAGASISGIDSGLLALSDKAGHFIYRTEGSQKQLKVSMMGYKTQIITLKEDETELNIQMDADALNLSEVRVS